MSTDNMEQAARIALAEERVQEALRQEHIDLIDHCVVGSTYIRDRVDSDVDVLCLVSSPVPAHFVGWNYGGSACLGDESDYFSSWKQVFNGVEVNMLITTSREYYNSWRDAAEVCRFLHLAGVTLPTALVHGVHEIIMDGSDAATEAERRTAP